MHVYLDSHPNSTQRALTINTRHSVIKTPVFMPVGTQASIKALDSNDMLTLGAEIILANTYHLYLRPGPHIIKNLGGLHHFCNFPKSFLTDSGGFQAFSLSHNIRYHDEGILFKSHIDGSKHLFTPQKVLDIQYALNSDIMMVLDDLIALPADNKRLTQAVQRTILWAKQSMKYHQHKSDEGNNGNHIFAIIQGGTDKRMRKMCADELCALPFDGYAIGGLAVGEPNLSMYETIAYTIQFLPKDKPRYLMGVGTPQDIIESISCGVDMFDCVMPSRNARNGTLFIKHGKISIKAAAYKNDSQPIDENCLCHTCRHYTRAYLHHLFKTKELSYYRLATIHNLYYYLKLMSDARQSILNATFTSFRKEFYHSMDMEIPQYDGCIF